MDKFVVNEWLWADLSCENGQQARADARALIEIFPESSDRFIVVKYSAFDQKAWALCKKKDLVSISIAKQFIFNIRLDDDHCLILDPKELNNLPDNLSRKVKPDDHYLVQAQSAIPGSVIVTTDKPLIKLLRKHELLVITREDFLSRYIAE